jgi:hypothetical protein
MFARVNKNFISTVVEGALVMVGESVDLNALHDTADVSGPDILPVERDVRKAARAVSKKWGTPLVMITCWVPFARSFAR